MHEKVDQEIFDKIVIIDKKLNILLNLELSKMEIIPNASPKMFQKYKKYFANKNHFQFKPCRELVSFLSPQIFKKHKP